MVHRALRGSCKREEVVMRRGVVGVRVRVGRMATGVKMLTLGEADMLAPPPPKSLPSEAGYP